MIIIPTIIFVITTAIIYIPLWLPILLAVINNNYWLLFYMFFMLLSFPLDFFATLTLGAILRR